MPRSKKATPSVTFSVLARTASVTLTAGTVRDVPTLGFDPQEPTFVVGGVIKYALQKAANMQWVRWALVRKERAATSPDIGDAVVLRDLWEDKHLLASGYHAATTEVTNRVTTDIMMVPIRKTTLRDDEELALILLAPTTATDYIEQGVTKVMHKRV